MFKKIILFKKKYYYFLFQTLFYLEIDSKQFKHNIIFC